MKVAVFGMGHVGLVTAALLAEGGHQVVGVDVDRERLALLQKGEMPFVEPHLKEIMREQLKAGRLDFTGDSAQAVSQSEMVLICVGTPTDAQGEVDLNAVFGALRAIADVVDGMTGRDRAPVVVLRSTVPPDMLFDLELYLHQACGGRIDSICVSPEFLREGSAVADFRYPVLVVVGGYDARAVEMVIDLYRPFGREDVVIVRTDGKTAMLVKYVSNAWHALKVTFANEIGDVARAVGVDGQELMRIFTQDTVLNISSAYLQPGAPYGGSCLPKDLAALVGMGERHHCLLRAIEASNAARVSWVIDQARASDCVGVVGLSFKLGTDDLRGSPWAEIVDRLLNYGMQVRIYDPDVPRSTAGTYARFLVERFDELEEWADTLIVGKPKLLPDDARLPERVIYGDSR